MNAPLDPKAEQVARLLREAHVYRLRGQPAEAETRCRAALELTPDHVEAREMLGELLCERGQLEEARACFEAVLKQEPDRPSAETWLGRVVVALAEREHEREVAEQLLSGGAAASTEMTARQNAFVAGLLSVLFAGLGQIYNREYLKGGLLVVSYAIGLAFGVGELFKLFLALAGQARVSGDGGFAAVLGLLAVFAWIYGVIDAPARARQLAAPKSDL